jgi:pimeloyl-ACP methyl ester carboxylesterase
LGEVEISLNDPAQVTLLEALDAVLLADTYAVHGLDTRNRTSGLGTPVIAVKRRDPKRPLRQSVGATILLSCSEPKGAPGSALRASLQVVMTADQQEGLVGGLTVPLETDQTTPLAYALSDPIAWKLGRQVFRLGQAPACTGLFPAEPYVPGKIPVLFVHGTMSSPIHWADMWNTLRADPEIRRRYQFWFYFYESGYPLLVSATRLRESITGTVADLDPQGKDPALKQMVVIGHSQGGLLARLTAVDTGETLVRALTGRSLAELDLSAADRATVERYFVIRPLPQVRRLVFVSTPHGGSYQASGLVRGVVRRLVRVPVSLTQVGATLSGLQKRFSLPPEFRRLPTSVDGMSPKSPLLRRLAGIPLAAGVHAHSIIPIKGDDTPPEGKDGVVAYASAHLDGVESEYVVRDGHSCQGNPLTIEEVRRILLEHLKQGTVGSVPERTH